MGGEPEGKRGGGEAISKAMIGVNFGVGHYIVLMLREP